MERKAWFTAAPEAVREGNASRPVQVGSRRRPATRFSKIRGEWTTGDISVFGFILSLALIGAILAAYSDRPAFWLLVGLGPVAVGFTIITFVRQRFGRRPR